MPQANPRLICYHNMSANLRERGRSAPEGHSPVDGTSEGQATDGRAGGGLCQEGRRGERTSARYHRSTLSSPFLLGQGRSLMMYLPSTCPVNRKGLSGGD